MRAIVEQLKVAYEMGAAFLRAHEAMMDVADERTKQRDVPLETREPAERQASKTCRVRLRFRQSTDEGAAASTAAAPAAEAAGGLSSGAPAAAPVANSPAAAPAADSPAAAPPAAQRSNSALPSTARKEWPGRASSRWRRTKSALTSRPAEGPTEGSGRAASTRARQVRRSSLKMLVSAAVMAEESEGPPTLRTEGKLRDASSGLLSRMSHLQGVVHDAMDHADKVERGRILRGNDHPLKQVCPHTIITTRTMVTHHQHDMVS